MGVYDCLILDDCGTAKVCSLQKIKNVVFQSGVWGWGGELLRKSQAEFPSLLVIRAGKRGVHRSLAGTRMVPGVSLEADSASVQQPMRPERATLSHLMIPHRHSTARRYLAWVVFMENAITICSVIW